MLFTFFWSFLVHFLCSASEGGRTLCPRRRDDHYVWTVRWLKFVVVGSAVEVWPWLVEVRIQKVGQAHITVVQPSLPSSSSCIPFCFERSAKGGKEGGGDGTTQSREGETRPLPHAIMSAGVKAPVYTSVVHRKVQHHAWQGWCISTT